MILIDDDLATIDRYAAELVTAVDEALAPWLEAAIEQRHPGPVTSELAAAAADAGRRARGDVTPRLRDLLALDIDEQWTNPLSIIRSAVVHANEILANAGVPTVNRDRHDVRINPDDVYAIAPAAFADLGPRVHDAGLVWGAAKAHLHLKRHKARGEVERERGEAVDIDGGGRVDGGQP